LRNEKGFFLEELFFRGAESERGLAAFGEATSHVRGNP